MQNQAARSRTIQSPPLPRPILRASSSSCLAPLLSYPLYSETGSAHGIFADFNRIHTMRQIAFHRPSIGPDEEREVLDTLRSGWITTGPKAKRFEAEFAGYVGAKHALALSHCTGALHLSLWALGIGPGDEVITTPFTFTATAEVLGYLGARPVFVDVDPGTFNINPARIEEALESGAQQTRPRDPAGALRRSRLRHGSHPQHRAHLQSESGRGRRARGRLRPPHGRPRDGENRHHRRSHLLQLLRHQEFHHRRGRHDHHDATTRSRKKSPSPACTG